MLRPLPPPGLWVLRILSIPLGLLLFLSGWKRRVLLDNQARCGVGVRAFRLRIALHIGLDFLRLAAGAYGAPIQVRERDGHKLKNLKSFPSLFLTAHFHNWECMGGWLVAQGVPLLCAARPLASRSAGRLLHRMRRGLKLPVVEQHLPRQALRHLDRGGCFALLWDQRVSASPLRAPFFEVPLAVDPLPDFLLRHRAVPVRFGVLLPDGTFRMVDLHTPRNPPRLRADRVAPIAPAPRSWAPDSSWSPQHSRLLARRYHRVLELLIRRHPTWWYGMAHRRFLEADFLRMHVPSSSSLASATTPPPMNPVPTPSS